MTEPLPRRFDYQGNERLAGYVRGVTNVPCKRCGTTGVDPIANDPTSQCGNFCDDDHRDTGIPVCRKCGGYGCVPPNPLASMADLSQAVEHVIDTDRENVHVLRIPVQ